MAQGTLPRCVLTDRGLVYVCAAIFDMRHPALFFEGSKHRPYRRVAGRIGYAVHDFLDGRFLALVEEVHDLPLAAAEVGRVFVCHSSLSFICPTATILAYARKIAIGQRK